MPLPLPPVLRGVLAAALLGAGTITPTLAMVAPALLKLLLPFEAARRACERALTALASSWVALNNR